MGKVLVIAEKPNQMKQLAAPLHGKPQKDHIAIAPCSVFPEGAIVISACGHILKANDPEDYDVKYKEWKLETLPIIPNEFNLKVDEEKKFYLNTIKKYVNDPKITYIVNAGDPAVEGQLLIDEVLYFLKNKKPVKRLWTTSLTAESIIKAFQSMKDNSHYKGYYEAGLARQRADWIVGLSSSRALTILLREKGINKTFSAGRVQTALVGIIYQRELEIENFVSEPYWDCFSEMKFGEHYITGKWFNEDGEHIFSKEAAEILMKNCQKKPVQVYSINREEKKIRPPQLYNLSGLQMEANRLYGMTPASVLKIAQSLYDKSLITYPRTDSKHLTPGEAKWLPTILSNLSKLEDYKQMVAGAVRNIETDKRFVDETKVSDHYALCLTEEVVNPLTLSKGEHLIYDLIAKSVIAAHYPDFVFDSSEIIFTVKDRFSYKSKGKLIKTMGWKEVYRYLQAYDEKEKDEEKDESIPNVDVGDVGDIVSMTLKDGDTTPPNRFTEGDLIKVMSNAAYYVKERGDFQNKELSLGTEATRSGILDTIKKRYILVDKNKVYLQPEGKLLIEALGEENYLTSVLTTGNMERYLHQLKLGKGTLQEFIKGTETVTRRIVQKLIEDSSKWNFDKYVTQIQEAEELGNCKLCGEAVVDKGAFYGCSGFEKTKCSFTISKNIKGKNISKDNVMKILTKGHSALIKGFKRQGKDTTYDAYLVWNENMKKIDFKYPNK